MRVLFVSAWFPQPPSNGSRLRVHHLLRALAAEHEVTLLSFADEPGADAGDPTLRELCRTARVLPRPSFDPGAWRSRAAWLATRPRSLVATHSAAMAGAIGDAAAACDLVIASQLACAAYAPWFGGVPALFEEVELGWLFDPPAAGARSALTRAKYRFFLRRLLRHFRACTVVSERERALLARVAGARCRIEVLPNAVDAAAYPPREVEPDSVVFTGSFRYRPNYQAMRWFLADVWPRVLAARPAARLRITGAHDDLPLPAAPRVERTGFVPDVRPLLAAAAVAVAPIHAGGGTRVKILEAMAAGAAVVATAKGAEGIDAVAGEHMLIVDDPTEFADAVIDLLANGARRARLAAAARALIEQRYDWRIVGPRFAALARTLVP